MRFDPFKQVNTETASFTNRGILHTQGGWPKDVDAADVEHTIRYRKKIEKDDEYVRSIKSLGDVNICNADGGTLH